MASRSRSKDDENFVRILREHQTKSKKLKSLIRKAKAYRSLIDPSSSASSHPSLISFAQSSSPARTYLTTPNPTFETLELKFEDDLLAEDPNETMNTGGLN